MAFHFDEFTCHQVHSILETIEELNHLKDVDAILDKILYESRRIANADAGSIFIAEEDLLRFGYVHNDTLFRDNTGREALYIDYTLPISETSIVGHVALTKETLAIADAYQMSPELPYAFNPAYDYKSGYRTLSMLALPLITHQDRLMGVMQLINAKDDNGRVVAFSKDSQMGVQIFANNAAVAIERGVMNRELILRMVKMAELRDPSETGAHVQRVGAISSEIYQRWAAKNGLGTQEMKRNRDLIRLASMLHDIGKIGAPDHILKKPGKLTDKEFDIIKKHTIYGSRLFVNQTSPLDAMCQEIALNHHEKWDGSGYPGKINDLFNEDDCIWPPKSGTEIPLAARIVALADVYDALSSKRVYKESWPEHRVLETIEARAGKAFDPELVAVFFDIYGVIQAIENKFQG
ncbi:MAG: HD domain-containing protein [Desulfobacterales bacterium]|nr:HD domain-containing protein [Desulfobacterales bacterium]